MISGTTKIYDVANLIKSISTRTLSKTCLWGHKLEYTNTVSMPLSVKHIKMVEKILQRCTKFGMFPTFIMRIDYLY